MGRRGRRAPPVGRRCHLQASRAGFRSGDRALCLCHTCPLQGRLLSGAVWPHSSHVLQAISLLQASLLEASAACTGRKVCDVLASIVLPLLRHPPPLPSAEAAARYWRKCAAAEVRKQPHSALVVRPVYVHSAAAWLAQLLLADMLPVCCLRYASGLTVHKQFGLFTSALSVLRLLPGVLRVACVLC